GNLAAEGAEAEGVHEAPLADLADVGDALAGPLLGALVEEDDAGAVDNVGLHAGDVQHLLDLRDSDHVVVGRPSYLKPMPAENHISSSSQRFPMVAVTREAEGAQGAVHAVETVHITLALVGVSVPLALHEEARRQQRAQPRRPLLLLLPSRSLFQSVVSDPARKHKTSRRKREKATSFRIQDKNLTMIPLFLLSSSLNGDSRSIATWIIGKLPPFLPELVTRLLHKERPPTRRSSLLPYYRPLYGNIATEPSVKVGDVVYFPWNVAYGFPCSTVTNVNFQLFKPCNTFSYIHILVVQILSRLDFFYVSNGLIPSQRDRDRIPITLVEFVPSPVIHRGIVGFPYVDFIDRSMGAEGMMEGRLVFTYGTLKRGFSNHGLLQDMVRTGDAAFVGAARTAGRLPLVCGPYRVPFLLNLPGAGERVSGELYAISPRALARMDELEGTRKGHYERLPISVVVVGGDGGQEAAEVDAEAYYAHRSYAGELWRRNEETGYKVYSEKEAKGYVKRADRPQDITFLDQIRIFLASPQT
ncbi:unnamed protein product, partial [Musa acuminata var. zebrina]